MRNILKQIFKSLMVGAVLLPTMVNSSSVESKLVDYESLVNNIAANKDKKELQDAINFLRSYYVKHNQLEKLDWLNKQLLSSLGENNNKRNLLELLLELETVSHQITAGNSVNEYRTKITGLIKRLQEFRWFERDLNRALSYVAIGRCYFLLNDYYAAVISSNVDIELFYEIDREYRKQNQETASPRAALLFLHGNCYQKIAEESKNKQDQIKYFGLALENYFAFIMDYPRSNLARDAWSRYENCRSEFEKISGEKVLSLADYKLPSSDGNEDIPPSIHIMIQSGNYALANETLSREIKDMEPTKISPHYLKVLAECNAQLLKADKCREYLNLLLAGNNAQIAAAALFNSINILRNKEFSDLKPMYELFLNRFGDDDRAGLIYWAMADSNLNNLRLVIKKHGNPDESKLLATQVIAQYAKALDGVSESLKQYYILSGRAEAYFLVKNYDLAIKDYQAAASVIPSGNNRALENLANALFVKAIQQEEVDKTALKQAEEIIDKYNLAVLENPGMIRLLSRIKEKSGHKKEAGELLMKIIDNAVDKDKTLPDLAKASALFYEAQDHVMATRLLDRMSQYRTRDIVKTQFAIGVDLLSKDQLSDACRFFEIVLKNEESLSIKEMQYLIENLYNASGPGAAKGWYIAFRAGRLLESQKDKVRNKPLLENLRLKTASAALRLKNYATVHTICDMILAENANELYFHAKILKADAYLAQQKYDQARLELTEAALAASRSQQMGIFLLAKLKTAQVHAAAEKYSSALFVLDNVLSPLKTDPSIKPNTLPSIYNDYLNAAIQYAGQMKNLPMQAEYRALQRKLFPAKS